MTDQSSQEIGMRLHRSTLDQLRTEALRRGVRADELAADLLRDVVTHGLFAAVLGRQIQC